MVSTGFVRIQASGLKRKKKLPEFCGANFIHKKRDGLEAFQLFM